MSPGTARFRKPTARVPPPDAGRAEARPPVAPLILSFSRREKERCGGALACRCSRGAGRGVEALDVGPFSRREKDRMRGFFGLFNVEWAMAFSPGEIEVIKRMACGFRDDHDVFLKIRAAFPSNPG